jgi:hypothetical protein
MIQCGARKGPVLAMKVVQSLFDLGAKIFVPFGQLLTMNDL